MADGTYIDTQTGKVTTSLPEEGIQLHAPEVEKTPQIEAAIETAKVAAGQVKAPKVDEDQSVLEPATDDLSAGSQQAASAAAPEATSQVPTVTTETTKAPAQRSKGTRSK